MGEVKAARPRPAQILAPRRPDACILGADARPGPWTSSSARSPAPRSSRASPPKRADSSD